MGTVTRDDLARAVRLYFGSHEDARAMVDQIVNKISHELVHGKPVKISSFATFGVRRKPARIGRNPKKPEDQYVIEPRRVVVFTPSQELRKKVATQVSKGEFR